MCDRGSYCCICRTVLSVEGERDCSVSRVCVWSECWQFFVCFADVCVKEARLAQSVERKTLNLVVVGSSPTVGDCFCCDGLCHIRVCVVSLLHHYSLTRIRTRYRVDMPRWKNFGHATDDRVSWWVRHVADDKLELDISIQRRCCSLWLRHRSYRQVDAVRWRQMASDGVRSRSKHGVRHVMCIDFSGSPRTL